MGTLNQGSAAQLKIGTADPPTILIEGVKSGNRPGSRPTTVDDFYNQEASDTSVGKATRSVTVGGICESAATGLILAKASFDDDSGPIIYVSVSLNGVTGETLPSRCSTCDIGFPDANRKCTYNLVFSQADDPTPLAGGDIFD